MGFKSFKINLAASSRLNLRFKSANGDFIFRTDISADSITVTKTSGEQSEIDFLVACGTVGL